MQLSRALKVCSLVLVDNVGLCQLVKHSCYLWQQSLGCALLGSVAESLDSVAGSLVIKTVVRTLGCCLADSLL